MEIQVGFTVARQRVAQVVDTLSSEDLFDPTGRAAVIGQPLEPLILGIYEHYEEHAQEIEILWGNGK